MVTIRILQAIAVAGIGLTLAVSPALIRITHSDEGGSTPAFVVSFLVLIAGQIMATLRAQHIYRVLCQVARSYPIRFRAMLLNLLLCGWLTINVMTRCGIVVVLFVTGLLLISASVCSSRRVTDWVRLSPISFVAVYLLLCAGEVFLRYNPLLVGGGGGGNPALPQIYARLYEKNSYGMRGAEFPPTPAAGTFRLVMLGDSFTFGQGVGEGGTYPDQVRRQLSRRDTQTKYDVINAGRSGTDTLDQLQCLRDQCLAWQPDLVTVQFYLNDLEPRLEATTEAGGFVDNVVMLPAYRSYAVFFLKFRFEGLRDRINKGLRDADPGIEWMARVAERIGPGHDEWSRFEQAVEGFAEIGRAKQLPIVFILLPHPGLNDLSMLRGIHESVQQRVEAAGLPVLDLIDVWSDLDSASQVVSPIDHHPSETAHKLTADRIVQELEELLLLP